MLNIGFIEEITLGEAISIILTLAIGIVAFARWILNKRVYSIVFYTNPKSFPSDNGNETGKIKVNTVNRVVYTKITALKGVTVDKLCINLSIKKWFPCLPVPFPLWSWKYAEPSLSNYNFISHVWDIEADNPEPLQSYRKKLHQNQAQLIDGFKCQLNYFQPLKLLKNDPMWLTIPMSVVNDWKGYLEFRLPQPDGKYSLIRRRIIFSNNPPRCLFK